jgi:stage V sporulation protein B
MLGSWQVLLNLDLWSLKTLGAGPGEVIGLYIASFNIPRMLLIIPHVAGDVLFTSLAWALSRQDEALAQRYLQAATRFTFVVLVPCCVLLAMHAEAVMALVYSKVYGAGGVYLRLQLIAIVLLAFLNIFTNVLAAGGKYTQSVGLLSALIPGAVLFNVVLIPQFGALGAATSLVLTSSIGAAAGAILVHRQFGVLIRPSTVVRVIVAMALVALVGTQLPFVGAGLLLKFFALLGGYVLLLSVFREIKREDLRAFALWQKARHGTEIAQVEN